MTENKVISIVFSDNSNEVAVFMKDGFLSIQDLSGFEIKKFIIKNVKIDYANEFDYKGIRLYFYSPYVCVSERFGLNATLVNISTDKIIELSREDYQSSVSSYSIGFLNYQSKVLLIHQTQWNRLDITDLSTNQIVTSRKIHYEITDWVFDEKYKAKLPKYNNENYLDFFHSLISTSPDGSHFLSNGWLWHPVGEILVFKTTDFLETHELSNRRLLYWTNDNWDCPCVFIDSTHFVAVTDGKKHWKNPDKNSACMGLWFFNADEYTGKNIPPYYAEEFISPYKKIKCNIFKLNKNEGIAGELYYDSQKKRLIAMSEKGAFILNLDGKIIKKFPNMKLPSRSGFGFISDDCDVWRYNAYNHCFYLYNKEKESIEWITID